MTTTTTTTVTRAGKSPAAPSPEPSRSPALLAASPAASIRPVGVRNAVAVPLRGQLEDSDKEDFRGEELIQRLHTDTDDFLERLQRAEQRDSATRLSGCGGAWQATPPSSAHSPVKLREGDDQKAKKKHTRECGMCGMCAVCALPRPQSSLEYSGSPNPMSGLGVVSRSAPQSGKATPLQRQTLANPYSLDEDEEAWRYPTANANKSTGSRTPQPLTSSAAGSSADARHPRSRTPQSRTPNHKRSVDSSASREFYPYGGGKP
jgi:hypothetical protein